MPQGNKGEVPDKESLEVIEQLEKEGHAFEDIPGRPPKEETPKEEKPKVEEEPKEQAPEDKVVDKETEELEEPIEPRQVRKPAWKEEMEKRRERQGNKEVLEKLDSLTQDINELKKGTKSPEAADEREEKIKAIKEKYEGEINSELLDEIISLIPKEKEPARFELPEEVKTNLADLEKLRADENAKKEDNDYADAFTEKVLPLLKADFPQATDEDLKAVRDRLKGHYFDQRYINLPIEKIYNAERGDLSNQISPETRKTAEKAKKGLSKGEDIIDYDNITEEQMKELPMEEQEKALDALSKKSKL